MASWAIPMGEQVNVAAELRKHGADAVDAWVADEWPERDLYEEAERRRPCPSCNDLGFQSGAHTDHVVPCPTCVADPDSACCGDPADCNETCQ